MFSEGVSLVYHKLQSVLNSKGLESFEPTGEDFDSELHDAITEVPAPSEDMKGKVVDTIEKGYRLNERIIRYAKVVVGK
jgi:molecular chaperone GrpE